MDDTDSANGIHFIMMIIIFPFFPIFLSISFSGFYIERTDKIILIVSRDYHDISLAKRKYKARREAHIRRKSKNRSATVFTMDHANSLVKTEKKKMR